ncbi:hypothetical protein MKW94_015897 [Papaver nudicaule]|uniref:Uncharacterized protein n=1 Tax=Papaver nudicaule TaxID=74823 RepID=A0AA42B397_PAPNU|nr:hypothetical protein [Papaver nudicaule]
MLSNSSTPSQQSMCSSSISSSLQSNLSLQTLPSVLSLQKSLSPETLKNLNVSHHCLFSFRQTHQITCLAVSSNLLYVASGHEINVFDLSNNTHVSTFNDDHSDSGSVKSITFSGAKIFTAHQDCKIRVWKLLTAKECNNSHKLIATLPTLNDRLCRFVLPKNYVRVRRHKKQLWIQHSDAVSGVYVNNDLIYSVSWDKCLKIWRSKDLVCLESVKAHDDAVNSVAVSADGTVYTGSADNRIRVWGKGFNENKKHSLIATLEKHKSAVNALALSADGSVLFSGACDRSILVWEREDSAEYMSVTGALRGHRGAILCLINVCDLLVSGSADRTIRVWQRRGDSQEYCCLAVLEGHEKPVKSLVAVSGGMSEGSVTICSGSLDGEVKVWQINCSL